ncbi:MAG: hypothetical protein QM831_20035 [Kofleriaceae bacterium]
MKRVMVALALVAGCKSGPSKDQCKQLLDHLVDLEFKKSGAAATTDQAKQDIAKAKAAVIDARTNDFMDTCQNKMTKARVDCALAASDLDGEAGVGKCDESK